ncbi:MAG: hypothetical protein MJY69_08835 [Bacteroidales bacterium]|nr:hypothetical protein [Bacteroidales bacterium]
MKMKHILRIILAATALTLTSCLSEDSVFRNTAPGGDDGRIEAGSSIDAILPFGANQLSVNVTVSKVGDATKASVGEVTDTASVEVVSFRKGENAQMPEYLPDGTADSPATKSIYNYNTTSKFTTNFLRLDETIGETGAATYSWENWGKAKLLEAEVVSAPENDSRLFYRSITFTPTQAYNIRTYNDDIDTLFYHSRLIGWHPMILSVPRDGDKAAAIEFSNSRYANNRYNITAEKYGVVFDHALDGSVDLMMSNMVEGQRWHRKFDPREPESREKETYNVKHYADKDQTQEEVVYSMPFGHYTHPEYSNPIMYRHYLSAVRLWAVVENSGETTNMNLKTWGEIVNVSFVDQPSTAIIALPEETSSPLEMDEYGKLRKEADGSYYINRQKLTWGNVISWGDETNHNIHSDRLFGDDANNKEGDYTVQYPIDMTKDGGVRLTKTYLGYCLVKPFQTWELSEEDGIKLAIQTSAGIYYATIPSIASYDDGAGHVTKENMFQESQIYDVILNLRTEGSINEFIEKENDVNYVNLSPYDNQNQNFMSANCYVIDKTDLNNRFDAAATEGPAGYCFTGSIMGNGLRGVVSDGSVNFPTDDAVIRGGTSARIVWQSDRNLITNVQLQHEYVRFIVNKNQEGNAVLAITDANGKILWSWHIWITEDPTKSPLEVTINPGLGEKIKMLDRNLGALSNNAGSDDATLFSSFGLYYQWGRKDPLPGPIEKNTFTSLITPVYDGFSEEIRNIYANSFGSGIEASIQNPMNYLYCDDSPYYQYNWMQRPIDFLWGLNTGGKIQKSIYDPCPFGYRVAHEEIQNLFENAKSIAQADGKGVTLTSEENIQVFFPYAGFIGSERGQYSREPEFNYVAVRGDYTSGFICPPSMASLYQYFTNHRLRTYISKDSWTEENIDGQQLFNFSVPEGKYRVSYSITSPRDYTNRTSAATVRCVQDKSYEGKGYANLTLPQNYSSKNVVPGAVLPLTIKGGLNVGLVQVKLTIQPCHGDAPVGAPTEVILTNGSYSEFNVTKRTTTVIEGTYNYTYPSDFIEQGITTFKFRLDVSDKENPDLEVEPANQKVNLAWAQLLIQDNSTTAPTSGRPFLTVDTGRNLTKTNEPVVGQPAYLTVYALKNMADLHAGEPVVTGKIGTKTYTFNKQSSTVTIGGKEYYEFRSSTAYTNDYKGASGGKINCNITLNFSDGDTSEGSIDSIDKEIKIWGLVTGGTYGRDDRFIRKGIFIMRVVNGNYYLNATSKTALAFSSDANTYDYSSLFYNTSRVSWRWGVTDPQGPTTIKSVMYSIPNGENRFWYVSDTSRGSGATVTLNTSGTNIYFLDTQERTIYTSGSTQLGTYLHSSGSSFIQTGSRASTPSVSGGTGYHYLSSIYMVKDPDASSAQYLPFTGTGSDEDKADDGNFNTDYLVF